MNAPQPPASQPPAPETTAPRTTATYYDALTRWTRVARWAGYGGGYAQHTVHRSLADPRAGGRPTPTRLHDLLAEALPALDEPRVLDAGCGLGGTLMDFAERFGGRCVGVTLSESQARLGRDEVARRGLEDRVQLLVGSYDDPPDGPFDLIVAIESLAHSPHPPSSIEALARRLSPGGVLAVVDDMPAEPVSAAPDPDLDAFRSGWQCPVLLTASQYRSAFAGCGLALTAERDWSPAVVNRPAWRIAVLERLNRAAAACLPQGGWQTMLASYRGGLALERLYRGQRMTYRLLVARRPGG